MLFILYSPKPPSHVNSKKASMYVSKVDLIIVTRMHAYACTMETLLIFFFYQQMND